MLAKKQKKESRPVYSLRMPAWAIAFIKQNEVNVEKIILSAIEKEVSKNARKGAWNCWIIFNRK